jgi:hypothetical protein
MAPASGWIACLADRTGSRLPTAPPAVAPPRSDAGWKVRVYTGYGGPGLSNSGARKPVELWGSPDKRTLWLAVDPSSPNILNMVYIGEAGARPPPWSSLERHLRGPCVGYAAAALPRARHCAVPSRTPRG